MPDILIRCRRSFAEAVGREVILQGWVRTRRDSKAGFSFLEINDGSCFGNIQVLAEAGLPNYESEIKRLSPGCSVSVTGLVKASPGKGQATEVQATAVTVHGMADVDTYPLQKKGHSFEFLRTIAHLRPRTNTFGAVARVRNCVCNSIHQFFQERGFLYVHTPIITASDCEGAGAMFQVTTLDLNNVPKKEPEKGGKAGDRFLARFLRPPGVSDRQRAARGRDLRLRAGQDLHVRPHLPRREQQHAPPPGRVLDGRARGGLLRSLGRHGAGRGAAETHLPRRARQMPGRHAVLQRPDRQNRPRNDPAHPRQRVPPRFVHRGRRHSEKSGETFEFPVAWGNDLQAEHERYLTEKHFKQPVILYDYPRTIKPFYMRVNDDGRTVRAMDVLVPKVGEIIGGSQREERLDVLEERMKEQGLNPEGYWWYLDLRRYGTVPHAGFGLGPRTDAVVHHRHGEHPRRDPLPPHAGQRRISEGSKRSLRSTFSAVPPITWPAWRTSSPAERRFAIGRPPSTTRQCRQETPSDAKSTGGNPAIPV